VTPPQKSSNFGHTKLLTRADLSSTMASLSLASFLLDKIPFRLPIHLYTYVEGVTPLSTDKAVLSALASYLVIIFSIQAFMKYRQPFKLTALFQTHNVILSSGSLLLLALMLEEMLPMLWNNGLHSALCDEKSWTSVSLIWFWRVFLARNLTDVDRKWNSIIWLTIISNIWSCWIPSSSPSKRNPFVCHVLN